MQVLPKKLGIIGCGAIGSKVARQVQQHLALQWELVGVCASSLASAAPRAKELQVRAMERADLLAACDFIIEATQAAAMPAIVRDCLSAQVPVLAVSVGGFALDTNLQRSVEEAAGRVYVPSGAIAGLDGVLALREQGLDSVELCTVKHPRSLPAGLWEQACPAQKAEHLVGGLFSAQGRCVFEGNAAEAIRLFPANANVAIALSLAGVGFEATQVRIVADPLAQTTLHCVKARAGQSMLECITRPVPLVENPRSSIFAILSIVAILRKLGSVVRVGT